MNVAASMKHIGTVDKSSTEILTAVAHVRQIANQSNENAASISAATQQQSATMQEVADASKLLSELAKDLQGEVSQFKL